MATELPKVSPLFQNQQPEAEDPGTSGVATLRIILNICAARSLALITVLGAVAIWGYAVYDPQVLRLYAGAGFSVGVLIPTLYLYWRLG